MEKQNMKLLSDYVQGQPAFLAAQAKRRLYTTIYFLSIGIVGEAFLLLKSGRFFGFILLGSLIIATIFWFAVPSMIKSSAHKFTTELYANPKFSWVFGERSLEIFEDGFGFSSECSSGKNLWKTVSSCGFIEDAFVMIIGPTTGFVIKQDQVIEGDFSAFASEVMRRTQAS